MNNYKDQFCSDLPLGIQRRVEIARSIAAEPKILLLDEPASGMIDSEKIELKNTLKNVLADFKLSIFLIEHDMEFVMELADRIIVLNFGSKLAEGTPREIVGDQNVVNAYLGKEWDHAI